MIWLNCESFGMMLDCPSAALGTRPSGGAKLWPAPDLDGRASAILEIRRVRSGLGGDGPQAANSVRRASRLLAGIEVARINHGQRVPRAGVRTLRPSATR